MSGATPVILIDGVAYPYHLAISPRWMVHYLSSPMAEHEWMCEEEARFLSDPSSVFARWEETASAIAHAIGLDYVGLDMTQLADGTMLVFEADPAMLVHDEDPGGPFAYKRGAVGAIPGSVFPPAEAVTVPGGCVVGAIGGLSTYLATIWGNNNLG